MKKSKGSMFVIFLGLVLSLFPGAGCELFPEIVISPPPGPPPTENITPSNSKEPTAPTIKREGIDTEWTIPPVESSVQSLPNIADVVASVKPSVVAISTEVVAVDFFNRPRTQQGVGSGWIIREDGIIVTNNHVVKGAERISVTLDDGRTFLVELSSLATDPLTDLAVLKIEAENLPVATIGNSSRMRVGDWVVAIGNALGEGTRATQGIVSRQDISVPVDNTQVLYGLIETDAAINPGNSGGPLVNMAGEVIGITSAKLSAVEIEGTGFAIGVETAIPVIQQLIKTGYAVHPWLGVSLYPVNQLVIERFELTIDRGVFIMEAVADSPAGRAGLEPEDVIVSFAGKDVETVEDLIKAIRSAQVGQEVAITFWRGGNEITTSAILIERP
tara:strand:+ start:89 stop:1252 length:1164 start_codon:yes stop_codon:yes gene_type:complete